MEKNIRKISTLKPFEENPRAINKSEFELLKKYIKEYGQFKPIIINQEGIILGGNMRYKAYLELGIKDIWVSEVKTKNKAEIIKYNLLDNMRFGYYQEQELAELIYPFRDEINLKNFLVDIDIPKVSLETIIGNVADLEKDDFDVSGMELQAYEHYDYCMLVFKNTYDWINFLTKAGIGNVNYSIIDTEKKIGLGRVIDGAKFMEGIEFKNNNNK